MLRVSLLEDWLARVSFLPDGEWRLDRTWIAQGTRNESSDPVPKEGRSRDDLTAFGEPSFDYLEDRGVARLSGRLFSASLDAADGAITWADAYGMVFARDLPGRAYTIDERGRSVYHYLERRGDEAYYGLGERAGPLDKKGLRVEMRDLDALGYDASSTDPLYKHWPIYITYLPSAGIAYALVYDNLSDSVFDLGKEIDAYHGDYRYWKAADGDIDYYLVFGPGLREVVSRIGLLIGRMALPPRWSLGYLGSGMGYTDSEDPVGRLSEFVAECDRSLVPCDMFHLSSGYSMSDDGQRWVFEWNRRRVPEPAAVAQAFHDGGMKVCANIKPCLLLSHPEYRAAAEAGVFLSSGGTPHVAKFWGGDGSYIDFSSERGYAWWKERVRDRILAYGIDATWNDNNEYEVWDDEVRCDGFGGPFPISLGKPLHSLLMAKASREAQLERVPGLRPYLLTRSGCPGVQRYAQTWTGDNSTDWSSLKYNVPMGLGMSLSGMPNTGHDVGGFQGEAPSPELFVRWVQNGVFHPRFSIHSWRTDGTASEPWMYPEVLPIVRDAIRLRYELLPYLYSLLCRAASDGEPIIRPMVYEFPEDPRCVRESFDFMLGPALLVASVFEDGARTRRVYLPGEAPWCDFHTGAWLRGGSEVEVPAPLERPTLLVKGGSVVPMADAVSRIGLEPDGARSLYAFPPPGSGSGSFRLVEDDGESDAYLRGERTELDIALDWDDDGIRVRIVAARSGYVLPYRTIRLILPPGETRPLSTPGFVETGSDPSGRRILEAETTEVLRNGS